MNRDSERATDLAPSEAWPVRLPESQARDARSVRPYFLARAPFLTLVARATSIAVLLALDFAGVIAGLFAALVLREYYAGHTPVAFGGLWETEASWLPFVLLVTGLVFWHSGLYAPREMRAGFGQVLSSLVIVGVLTLAFAIGADHEFTTYGMVPTAVVLAALVAGLLRAGYHFATRELRRVAGIRRRAIVIGGPEDVSRVEAALGSTASGIAYEFLETPAAGSSGRMPRTVRDARSAIADQGVNEIIVADPEVDERDLLAVVDAAHRRGVKVRLAPRATEILAERGRYVPGQAIPLFEVRPPALAGTDWVLKRSFDLTTSILLLVVGLPLWLLIALAVKTSRGPVLYRDRRVGLNEREFFMFKFRTMHATAPERQAELETANQTDGALFKLRDDPRRTRVGAVLRRFSLDEIPQILNVLRGEMSLVGPRPLPLRDNARLEPWHRQRYRVLPGMTGLWQISGRSNLGFDDLVRLDFYYLENWSIWLDITILLRTVPAVLARRGAY